MICLEANKFVLLNFFPLLKTIYPRVSTKPLPNPAKSPLPADVRRSKMILNPYLSNSRPGRHYDQSFLLFVTALLKVKLNELVFLKSCQAFTLRPNLSFIIYLFLIFVYVTEWIKLHIAFAYDAFRFKLIIGARKSDTGTSETV